MWSVQEICRIGACCMKILLLHTDFVEWEPKKRAIKAAEEAPKKKVRVEEALVCLSAVEKADEGSPQAVAEKAADEILKVFNEVKADSVVLYPYAHLSSSLSSPAVALEVLKEIEALLAKKKVKVTRAPFGWYKAFDIRCKGHPLSELSKSIVIGDSVKVDEKTKIHMQAEKPVDTKQLLREISKQKLDRENLKDNDHRILGQRMDLFSFSETAPGMVFWHDKGWTIFNELIKFWREEHRKAGYLEVSTPMVLDKKLWQISGHWEKYRDNIFLSKYEGRDFAVKPMNCPGGLLIYKQRPKSYKDLPLRMAELGTVHRQELSGVLTGLFRVIEITQDDAHIFCTEAQLEKEIVAIMDLVDRFYSKFGFDYHMELSTRPAKRIGDDRLWDKAEKILEGVLKKRKAKFKINAGDGAFYGPKIDFHIKDSQGRSWQLATIQLDFAMPERFELTYNGEDNKPHTPVMLHRVVYGALERFTGILLEHTSGALPTWLAPVQVRVLSFTDRNNKAAEKIYKELVANGIRAELDIENHTVEHKVREAEIQKVPYVLCIGDKEEKAGAVAVRRRGDKNIKFGVRPDDFVKNVKEEIAERI
ncbi:MAG: threonine--tRNA ligase [Candidatus Aenigmarchaeota archaeon]|nr:threonine--tRNA ligase [Candidatus Aenigmarchaeota archaeon]